jgi:hypothetical protein
MRQTLMFSLQIVIFVATYFLLTEFARPALLRVGLSSIWWIVLFLYVLLLFAGFRHLLRSRPYFVRVGLLFFAAAVFSYDPIVNSHFAVLGLSWIWVAFLGVSILWLLVGLGRRQFH